MDRISTDDIPRRRHPTSQRTSKEQNTESDGYYRRPVRKKKKNSVNAAAVGKINSSASSAGRRRTAKASADADASALHRAKSKKAKRTQPLLQIIIESLIKAWRYTVSVIKNKRLSCDKPLIIIVMLLLMIGLVMMYSASYAYAYYEMGNSSYYIVRQVLFACGGIAFMIGISVIPPEKYKNKVPWTLLGISYLLLFIVLFMPRVNGVKRWIPLGFITFQPSEIAKFAVILWCAYYFSRHYKEIHVLSYPNESVKLRVNRSKFSLWRYEMWYNFKKAVAPVLGAFVIMLVLLLKEPHLSCTVLIVLIIAAMMYVGGVKKSYFGALAILGAIAFYLIIYTDIVPYGKTRIEVWKDPFIDKLGDGWQNIQSLYAISSGGLFGVGLGNSRQKYLYISEPQNDFIFAVICEEIGLVGASLIVLLFVLFVWRGFAISLSNPDKFSRFLGIGITSQIGFQALLNICVVTKIVPNTGISLPFFSSGGTSLLMLLAEIGVLLAISRRSPNKVI